MMTRREALMAGMAFAGGKRYAPIIAGQAYVWQQILGREKRSIADGLEDVMASLASAGYKVLELTNTFFTPELAERALALLKKHSMKLAVVYNGGVMHESAGAAATIRDTLELADRVKAAGIAGISFNANPKPQRGRKTDAELDTQTRAIEELGVELRKKRLRLMIHEHAPELAENAREWRHILSGTSPSRVEVCLDVHWVLRGGLSPMDLLKECSSRLASLHLRQSVNGVWLEDLADGEVDYRAVADYLRSVGFTGWAVVELALDPGTTMTRPLTENLRRSREYAERVFLRTR